MICKRNNGYGVRIGFNYPVLTSGHLWGRPVVLVWLGARKIILPRFIFDRPRRRIPTNQSIQQLREARRLRCRRMIKHGN